MMKTPLQISILLYVLSVISKCSQILWVNGTYTGSIHTGSQSQPFSSLDEALNSVVQFSSPYEIQILIDGDMPSNYSLGQHNIASFQGNFLTIKNSNLLAGLLTNSIEPCDTLPQILINDQSQLVYGSDNNPSNTGLTNMISFEGVKLVFLGTAPISNYFNFANVMNVAFHSVCFGGNFAYLSPDSVDAGLEAITIIASSSIEFSDIIFKVDGDFSISISNNEDPNNSSAPSELAVGCNNINYVLTSTEPPIQTLFTVVRASELNISNFYLLSSGNQTYEPYVPQLYSTANVGRLNVTNFVIQNCTFMLNQSFIEFRAVSSIFIQGVRIIDSRVDIAIYWWKNLSFIYLETSPSLNHIQSPSIAIDEFIILGSTLATNFSQISLLYGSEFQLLNLNFMELDPNVTITNVVVDSSALAVSLMLLNSSATHVTNFLLRNLTIMNSDITCLFIIVHYYFTGSLLYFDEAINWKNIENVTVANSIFTGTTLFNFIYGVLGLASVPLVNTFDYEYFKISNMIIRNNTFQRDADGYGYAIIGGVSIFYSVQNAVFIHNQLLAIPAFNLAVLPGHLFIQNSIVKDNALSGDTGFIIDQVLTNSLQTVSMLGDDFYMGYTTEFTRGIFLSSTTFERNVISEKFKLIMVASPFFYVTNVKFTNNIVMANSSLLACVNFNPFDLGLMGVVMGRQYAWVLETLYAEFPLFLNFRLNQTVGTARIPEEQLYYYLIENSEFQGNRAFSPNYFIGVGSNQADYFGFHLYGCVFDNIQTEGTSWYPGFINFFLLNNVRIEGNIFRGFNGDAFIIYVNDLYSPASFSFTNNTFDTIQNSGLLAVHSGFVDALSVKDIILQNLYISSIGIDLEVNQISSQFEFTDITATNVTLLLVEGETRQLNLLHVAVVNVSSSLNLQINHLIINSVTLIDNGGLSLFGNSLVFMSINTDVLLQNSLLKGINVQSENSLFALSANTVTISNCSFDSIEMNNTQTMFIVISKTFNVMSSSFLNYVGSSSSVGSIFKINHPRKGNQRDPLVINIVASMFSNSSAFQATILQLSKTQLNLTLQNNNIAGISTSQRGAFIFEACNFTNISIDSTQLTLVKNKQNYVSSLFEFSNCSAIQLPKSLFQISNTELKLAGLASGTLLTVSSCKELPLKIVNLSKVYNEGNVNGVLRQRMLSTSSITFGRTGYSLIAVDSADISFKNVTIANIQYVGIPLISVECSRTRENTNLVIGESSFSNLSLSNGNSNIIQILPSSSSVFCGHHITIKHSNFTSLSSDSPGTVIYDQQTVDSSQKGLVGSNIESVYLINNAFQDIINSKDGGIFYSNIRLATALDCWIISSNFTNISAFGRGGSFWFNTSSLHAINSIFSTNNALRGPAVWTENPATITPEILSNLTKANPDSQNLIDVGPNVLLLELESSSSLDLVSYDNSNYGISNVTSYSFQNVIIDLTLAAKLQDGSIHSVFDNSEQAIITFYFYLPQGVNYTLSSLCQPPSPCSIKGIAATLPADGGEYGTLNISYNSPRFSQRASALLKFRDCVPGEVKDESKKLCRLCDPNQYSLLPSKQCQACPQNAECPGGSIINVHPGYWRPGVLSENIYSCDDEKNPRCLGGSPGTACNEGYMGQLCLQCDTGLLYTADTTDITSCTQCENGDHAVLMATLYLLGTVIYQGILFYTSYQGGKQSFEKYIANNEFGKPNLDAYIRVINFYFQLLSVVGLIASTVYEYVKVGQVVALPSVKSISSLDCILLEEGYGPEKMYRLKVVLYLLSPLIKLALCIIALFMLYAVNKSVLLRNEYSSKVLISWDSACSSISNNLGLSQS